ncbi:MAG: isoprenylcysteine carboxylmethyltransferase family protein [Anaerolineales bacterium]|nr:isoprenylcysteine carboxylmethyltransferase family protein [Anaerolineales bacterium]
MKKYQGWAKRGSSDKQQLITMLLAGVVFILILPYLLYVSSNAIDEWLSLPKIPAGAAKWVIGLILLVGGFFLALWSIATQITIGRGTPVPITPTQQLVVKGPFAYCRNPMTLGTFFGYLGIGVWFGSISAMAIVLILVALLLLYIKRFEEKELEARFGEGYLEYKRNTPFILPRLRWRA